MLDMGFQIGVGSVIENTHFMLISDSFTLGVNIMTAPEIVVFIEVTCDKYLASKVPD